MQLKTYAPLLFLAFWSIGAIATKVGLQYADVWSFLLLRMAVALALLGLAIAWLRPPLKVAAGQWPWLLLCGFLIQVMYISCYFLSIRHHLSPGLVTIVLALQPLATALLLRDVRSLTGMLCLVAGFAGVVLAVYGAKDLGSVNGLGLLFAVAAMLSFSLGSMVQKRLDGHLLPLTALQYALALPVYLLAVWHQGWQVQWSWPFVGALAWMGGLVSVGALLLFFYMLSQGAVSRVNAVLYLVPVCTLLLDYWVFGTPIGILTVGGMLLVVGSVWLLRRSIE
ncbi:DMT family transporter [Neisseria shayeganii]|uniref:Membrane protein n=1 Tax=Neisseria shayeganii 871 TaxID=1032488 RepID=G4CFS3_9NEIS|nr:DMT family transporter [Neisseria shayeganii]EGY53339.1 membrane protein [Neisseria shayeganii 871]